MPSGLLYGPRSPRIALSRSAQALSDIVSWIDGHPAYLSSLPPLPSAGQPPYQGHVLLESGVIYKPPMANECSGVVALGNDADNQLTLWGLLYWGPARGGQANRRCLYQGRSLYLACRAVNNDLAYRVANERYYSDGPLRPLDPDRLVLPR